MPSGKAAPVAPIVEPRFKRLAMDCPERRQRSARSPIHPLFLFGIVHHQAPATSRANAVYITANARRGQPQRRQPREPVFNEVPGVVAWPGRATQVLPLHRQQPQPPEPDRAPVNRPIRKRTASEVSASVAAVSSVDALCKQGGDAALMARHDRRGAPATAHTQTPCCVRPRSARPPLDLAQTKDRPVQTSGVGHQR